MDSAFWRERQKRFADIDPDGTLLAGFNSDGWDDLGAIRWRIEGDRTGRMTQEFKGVAALCAVGLGFPDAPNVWEQWLDCLKRIGPGWVGPTWTIEATDGSDAEVVDVPGVCVVSARLCEALADDALKHEIAETGSQTGTALDRIEAAAERARKRVAVVEPLLQKRGWSPRQWAAVAGVDASVVYGYLRGVSMPRRASRTALADALKCPLEQLPD